MTLSVDASDFARAAQQVARAGPDIRREVAKVLRRKAEVIARDQRSAVAGVEIPAEKAGRGGRGQADAARAAAALARSRREVTTQRAEQALSGAGLRATVQRSIVVEARTSEGDFDRRRFGARIRVRTSGLPRSQRRLPFLMDGSRRSSSRWRHPVFGTDRWVQQAPTQPGWFYLTGQQQMDEVARAAQQAVVQAARVHGLI